MKVVISSDWHLDAVTAGYERFEDVQSAVRRIVADSIEWGADYHLVLGDITDPDRARSHRAVAAAIQAADVSRSNGVTPVFVVGNHDVIEDGHGSHTLAALDAAGFDVISRPTYFEGTLRLLVLPYTSTAYSYDPAHFVEHAAKQLAKPHAIVGHLNIEGITPGSETLDMPRGRDVFWPLDAIDKHYPDVPIFAGHYHEPQTFGRVVVVGSPERFTFGEEHHSPRYLRWEF